MKHRAQHKAKAVHAAPNFFQNARTREIDMIISRICCVRETTHT